MANLRNLISDLKEIERDCLGDTDAGKKGDAGPKLDSYQAAKRDLTNVLIEAKEGINRRNNLLDRIDGRDETSIRLRSENEKLMHRAKSLFRTMQDALEKDRIRARKKKKNCLSEEELDARDELIDLFDRDIQCVEASHKRRKAEGTRKSNFSIARRAQERQRRRPVSHNRNEPIVPVLTETLSGGATRTRTSGRNNDKSDIDEAEEVELQPLTQQEQQYIQKSNERDAILDVKLDAIHQGVKNLHRMGVDMNTELKVQEKMLVEVDDKITDTAVRMKTANQKMKTLLDQSGGLSRWCPIIICIIILLALLAFIYKTVV